MTLTPEFGNKGHLHHLPYADMWVANLWAIYAWQGQRQTQRPASGHWRDAPAT